MVKSTRQETGFKILGVETSSPVFSVAVAQGERILSVLKEPGVGRPSVLLMDLINEASADAGLELSALDGLAVSIGPGSFTGLRVGVMTVKTLAWALKKPVLPISSLEVTAQNFLDGSPQRICLFADARKGKVYTAVFSQDGGGGVRRLSEDRLRLPEEVLKDLTPGTLLVGEGVHRYKDLIASHGPKKFVLTPESRWIPTAEALCRIAASRWPSGALDDPHPLVPQYLYSQESDITGW